METSPASFTALIYVHLCTLAGYFISCLMDHMVFITKIKKKGRLFWVFSDRVNHGRCGLAAECGTVQLNGSYHEVLWQNFEIEMFQLLHPLAFFCASMLKFHYMIDITLQKRLVENPHFQQSFCSVQYNTFSQCSFLFLLTVTRCPVSATAL